MHESCSPAPLSDLFGRAEAGTLTITEACVLLGKKNRAELADEIGVTQPALSLSMSRRDGCLSPELAARVVYRLLAKREEHAAGETPAGVDQSQGRDQSPPIQPETKTIRDQSDSPATGRRDQSASNRGEL